MVLLDAFTNRIVTFGVSILVSVLVKAVLPVNLDEMIDVMSITKRCGIPMTTDVQLLSASLRDLSRSIHPDSATNPMTFYGCGMVEVGLALKGLRHLKRISTLAPICVNLQMKSDALVATVALIAAISTGVVIKLIKLLRHSGIDKKRSDGSGLPSSPLAPTGQQPPGLISNENIQNVSLSTEQPPTGLIAREIVQNVSPSTEQPPTGLAANEIIQNVSPETRAVAVVAGREASRQAGGVADVKIWRAASPQLGTIKSGPQHSSFLQSLWA